MAASIASIDELIEREMYNPSILKDLEAHLEVQKSTGIYHFNANRTLLKQYQFFPDLSNPTNVNTVLALSLMNLPSLDFSTFLHILPGDCLKEEVCEHILHMHEALETCKFKEFWACYNEEAFVRNIPGFADKVRGFIVGVLSLTFQAAPVGIVAAGLNLTEAEVGGLGKGNEKIVSVEGGVVKFAMNESNQAKTKVTKEAIQFKSMKGILQK